MIRVSKELVTKRFTGNEFETNSFFNQGVTINYLNKKFCKSLETNRAKRMKSQKKY